MIKLGEINEGNFGQIINMKLPDNNFVAPNVVSLAQAWLYYKEARPYAIYNDNDVVGFIMFSWDEENRSVDICRVMIAFDQQGKGYGTQALQWAIDMIRNEAKFDYIKLSTVPENVVAKHIYTKLGFVETGEVEHGEIVMKLILKTGN